MEHGFRSGRAIVRASYSMFYLRDLGSPPAVLRFPRGGTGLVVAFEGTAVVFCGRSAGPVDVTVEVHEHMPAPSIEGWDDVVELTLRTVTGEVTVADPAHHTYPTLPVLAVPPGTFRLRAHVLGRDAGGGRVSPDEVAEHHLLQFWPGTGIEPTVEYRRTDEVGSRRRRQAGGSESLGVVNVHRRVHSVDPAVVDSMFADLAARAGLLDVAQLTQLQGQPVHLCDRCGLAVRPNYCRDCGVYFDAGHRADSCPDALHDGHRTY